MLLLYRHVGTVRDELTHKQVVKYNIGKTNGSRSSYLMTSRSSVCSTPLRLSDESGMGISKVTFLNFTVNPLTTGSFFFQNVILFSNGVHHKCNIFR